MTNFQKHDRLRVVDATHRATLGARNQRQPVRGEIVEVLKALGGGDGSVQLVGFPLLWRNNRFELVERAVGVGIDGAPLYPGDRVHRVTGGGQTVEYDGTVMERNEKLPEGEVQVDRDGVAAPMFAPAKFLQLIRHHWEPPTPVVQYEVHDRVRVLDAPDRPAGLPAGEILTVTGVITGSLRVDQTLIFDDEAWPVRHFELVEHSTSCSDREGRPLYAGDLIRRHDDDGFRGAPYRGTVSATQSNRGAGIEVQQDHKNGRSTVWAPAQFVELIRHHWEPETPEETAEKGRDHWNHIFWGFDGSASNPNIIGYEVRMGDQPMVWVPTSPEDQARIARIGEELRRSLRKIEAGILAPGFSYNPAVDLPDGTVVVLTQAYGKPELHRIAGTFVDAKTGQPWTDEQLARWAFEITYYPRKDT